VADIFDQAQDLDGAFREASVEAKRKEIEASYVPLTNAEFCDECSSFSNWEPQSISDSYTENTCDTCKYNAPEDYECVECGGEIAPARRRLGHETCIDCARFAEAHKVKVHKFRGDY